MNTILPNITSGDARKIWEASFAIIHLRDPQLLDLLSSHLPEIEDKTRNIDLGGALIPNREHLQFAIRKLHYYRSRSGCLCRLYPEYLMYDPKREEKDGNVRILATKFLEGGWVDTYTCECTVCGTGFQVEEREYHYTWWGWQITPAENGDNGA